MSQNTSHAVMGQRHEAHDSLDDFPTPPWGTRALVECVIWPHLSVFNPAAVFHDMTIWEPACNRGFMARPLREYSWRVHASDVHDYSRSCARCGQDRICDFLFPGTEPPHIASQGVDWVITNPPFRLAVQFVHRAFAVGARNVAVLVRTAFLEGAARWKGLYKKQPPSFVAQFSERVPMVRGRCNRNATTATAYCWLVWMEGADGTQLTWIPPGTRKRLEREGDYDDDHIAATDKMVGEGAA